MKQRILVESWKRRAIVERAYIKGDARLRTMFPLTEAL